MAEPVLHGFLHGRGEAFSPTDLVSAALGSCMMTIMGIVTLGLMWLRMAKTANTALANGSAGDNFLENKLLLANFWAARVMPETMSLRRKVEAGADTLMAMPADAF